MTHPLTDELCEQIAPTCQWSGDIGDVVFRHSDIRTAADWQLEQALDWLKDYTKTVEFLKHPHYVVTELKKAMRPQQQEDNQ